DQPMNPAECRGPIDTQLPRPGRPSRPGRIRVGGPLTPPQAHLSPPNPSFTWPVPNGVSGVRQLTKDGWMDFSKLSQNDRIALGAAGVVVITALLSISNDWGALMFLSLGAGAREVGATPVSP